MTEAEWNACTDPQPMLEFLRGSERKMRLFDVACCRGIWELLTDEESRRAVEIKERCADALAGEEELTAAWNSLQQTDAYRQHWWGMPAVHLFAHGFGRVATVCASLVAWKADPNADSGDGWSYPIDPVWQLSWGFVRAKQADIIRDIYSFRLVTIAPRHLTAPIRALAEAIYIERAFDRLPILADALEDAGCTDPDILAHCRGGGEHARGCWVVDLLLGKE